VGTRLYRHSFYLCAESLGFGWDLAALPGLPTQAQRTTPAGVRASTQIRLEQTPRDLGRRPFYVRLLLRSERPPTPHASSICVGSGEL